MKNLLKTLVITAGLLALTGSSVADSMDVDARETFNIETNLEPGYAEVIDRVHFHELDEAVVMYNEFEKPSLYLSDEGLFRYAFYEKTGIWLDSETVDMGLMEPF